MFETQIKEMVDALINDPSAPLKPGQRASAIKVLTDYWKNKIAITWDIADVLCGSNISEDDAREVLQTILNKHDPNIGVTWDVLRIYADDYPRVTKKVKSHV